MAGVLGLCHAALLSDGRVLIVGQGDHEQAEIYNPKTGTFSSLGALPYPSWLPTVSPLKDGRALVTAPAIGDYAPGTGGLAAELFDPKMDGLVSIGAIHFRSAYTATTLSDSSVLLAGGVIDNTYLNSAIVYCP